MTIARYYIKRLPLTDPPADNALVLRAPNPWTWAIVRGVLADRTTRVSGIALSGGRDRVTLTVPISAGDRRLEGSSYELVIGDSFSSPNDLTLLPERQPQLNGAGITLNNLRGFDWVMDRDPPPPPGSWAFDPEVYIT